LGLENAFRLWFDEHIVVCTTLVDRIVPGTLNETEQHTLAQETGVTDRAALAAEPYRFWAIEAPEASLDHVRKRLAWLNSDHIVIEPDITLYRERKLRLLNGGHSASAIVGLLLGCSTVRELMEHPTGRVFVERVLREEIAPTLPYDTASMLAFAEEVLDRFRNPFLHHSLRTIATNSTTKLAVRVLPTIVRFYHQFGTLPELLALGFASYVLVMLQAPSSTVVVTWSDDAASTLPQAPENGYAASGSQVAFSKAVQTFLHNGVWSALHTMNAPQAALLSDALRQRCEQLYAGVEVGVERVRNGE
jgi:tagaturonate reductase